MAVQENAHHHNLTKHEIPRALNQHNQQIVSWLHEWYFQAQERGAKSHYALRKALASVCEHAGEIKSGGDAVRLPGIGPGIAAKIDSRLGPLRTAPIAAPSTMAVDNSQVPTARKPRRPRKYVPAFRSAPYAVLMALGTAETMSRSAIASKAHEFYGGNVILQDDRTTLSAALKTLQTKDLLTVQGGFYTLTEAGLELALRINPDLKQPAAAASSNDAGIERVVHGIREFPADQFEVHVLLDCREIVSRTERDAFVQKLAHAVSPVPVQVCQLSVGDVCWVGRGVERGSPGRLDVVLPFYLVERKRLDDFCASIIDKRYGEQKVRPPSLPPLLLLPNTGDCSFG